VNLRVQTSRRNRDLERLTGSDRLPHSFIVAAEYSLPRDRGLVRSVMPELTRYEASHSVIVYYHSFFVVIWEWIFRGIGKFLFSESWGWLGVNLFFLSGFLITGILLDSKEI